jgi:hypothetical protein
VNDDSATSGGIRPLTLRARGDVLTDDRGATRPTAITAPACTLRQEIVACPPTSDPTPPPARQMARLDPSHLRPIIETLAVLNKATGRWEFKQPDDAAMETRCECGGGGGRASCGCHPDAVARPGLTYSVR